MTYPLSRAPVIRPRITSSGRALLEERDVPALDRVLELAAARGEHVLVRDGHIHAFGMSAPTAAQLLELVEAVS